MPFVLSDGTAVARIDQAGNGATYVSWHELAARSGNPSWGDEAARGAQPYWRERAQRSILRAFNERRAA